MTSEEVNGCDISEGKAMGLTRVTTCRPGAFLVSFAAELPSIFFRRLNLTFLFGAWVDEVSEIQKKQRKLYNRDMNDIERNQRSWSHLITVDLVLYIHPLRKAVAMRVEAPAHVTLA
jgi:hypothetical protein